MRNKNYYINLNDREYLAVLSSLMNKRNKLIQNGKITKWSCRFLFALMCRIFHIYLV